MFVLVANRYQFQDLIEARKARRLNISKKVYSKTLALRQSLLGVALVALGAAIVWWGFRRTTSDQAFAGAFLIGTFFFVAGWCVPNGKSEYIDLEGCHVTKIGWYGILPPVITNIPLGDFSEVVVRHVCHPGGEAEDTYTGSVGLKRKSGGPVLWVKEFPATKDELPIEPNRYAKELSDLLRLPYAGNADDLPEEVRIKEGLRVDVNGRQEP